MQLWLLKLNGGIGRAIEHEGYLQRANATLSAENSAMSAGDLVERQAALAGMTIVAPGKLIFLHTRGSTDERLAAARLAQPVQAQSGTAASTAGAQSSVAGTESAAAGAQSSTAGTEAPSVGSQAPSASTQPATTGAQAPSSLTEPTSGG